MNLESITTTKVTSSLVVVKKIKLPTSCLYFVGSSNGLPPVEVSFKFCSIGVETWLQSYVPNLFKCYLTYFFLRNGNVFGLLSNFNSQIIMQQIQICHVKDFLQLPFNRHYIYIIVPYNHQHGQLDIQQIFQFF